MTFFIALEIVLWCKNWFMCHFYSPCFEYLEKCIFFLQVIQTQFLFLKGISNLIKSENSSFTNSRRHFVWIFHTSLTWRVIYRRFIKILQNDAKCPTLHWWALHHIFSPNWLNGQKIRKLSDPSFMGALSRFCKMTQTVRPFIYGCLRRFVLKSWWSSP